MLAYIRSIVAEKYGKEVAEDTTILYGGSCKASNAPELFSKPNIDGGLIGGASLKTADFQGYHRRLEEIIQILKCPGYCNEISVVL
jgi:triosephosphate isomerase